MKALFVFLLLSLAALAAPPRGWELSSSLPDAYRADLESEIVHAGRGSARLSSQGAVSRRYYGTLLQTVSALPLRGRRVRLTAQLRSRQVQGWAGLWLRADGAEGPPLAFENSQAHPLRGDHDWSSLSLELNVPPASVRLSFGVLLVGAGSVWLDDVGLQGLGPVVPGSGERLRLRGEGPINMDFELP